MGAIIRVREKNLAAEVATVKAANGLFTNGLPLLFKMADSSSVDSNAPMVIPSSSVHRSMEVWLRLAFGAVGPVTSVTAPVFYTDGVNKFGSGVTLYVRTTNAGTYSTPGVPADDSAGTDAFTYTSAAPKALDAVNAGPFSGTNADFGDYLVMWLTITTAALSQGKPAEFRLPLEDLVFTWTEQ